MMAEYEEAEGCKRSCQTLTILNTKLTSIVMDTNMLNIIIDPTVTSYTTAKSTDMVDIIIEVGSFMGFWLGFGILQIYDVMMDIFFSLFQVLKLLNKKI